MSRGVRSRQVPWPPHVAAVARSLAADGAWCWLDGEAAAPGEERVSVLGAARVVREAEPGLEREFLAMLGEDARVSHAGSDHRLAGHRFRGGRVVALSYEFGVSLMGVDPATDPAAPAVALTLDVVLSLDHETGEAWLFAPSEAQLDAWWARHGGAWEVSESGDVLPREREFEAPAAGESSRWRRTEAEYQHQVQACRTAIADGDAYVLCLTDRATVAGSYDPLGLFLRLRSGGPSVRGGVIVWGERALISASPERFLSVRGGVVATHPIKGTRPRGSTPDRDASLARDLAADPKERAENLMIVDLMRNDLSRVCEAQSVVTRGFLRVETHPHVHQLVSTVTGRLRADCGLPELIEATFPGGSMTGAPKRSAVEILGALEGGPRGLYSGCFGWIDAAGDAELAMTIRSVELRGVGTGSPHAFVGAGGGITADSDPAREEAERRLKAAPLLAALRH